MVSDLQISKLFALFADSGNCAQSAMRAGICTQTARRYLRTGSLPSQLRKAHLWRTREDPFAAVDDELRAMLKANPT